MTLSSDRLFDKDVYVSDALPLFIQKEFNEIKLGLLFLLEEIPISEMQSKWTKAAEHFSFDAVGKVFAKNQPVVVAGGKFGSGEMSFMSDLDVIFLLPERLKSQKPNIEKKIPDIQKNLLDPDGNQFLTMDVKLRPEERARLS